MNERNPNSVVDPFIIDMPTPGSLGESKSVPPPPATVAWSLVGLTVLLMWAPLAFGSTEPWSRFILRAGTIFLFALWLVRQRSQIEVSILPANMGLPILGAGALIAFQFFTGLTAYRYATVTESLDLISYGLLIIVAAELFDRRKSLRQFVVAMGIFGAALALFSLIQDFSGAHRIYWFRTVESLASDIYGPYVNHNHYAGLMEMLIPLAGAAALLHRGPRHALLVFATALMMVSIVLSRSRGGVIALAAEALFILVLLFRERRSRRIAVTSLAISSVMLSLIVVLGSAQLLDRFTEAQDLYRCTVYRDALRMAMHKPILGFGLGTFPEVYPAFRSFYSNLFVNHAHNDYLELFVDTGLLGLGLFVWMLIGIFRAGFRKATDYDDTEGRLLTAAVLIGIVGILVHSLLDFNLHIPANAALFFVLCAAAATPFKHRMKPAHLQNWRPEDDPATGGNSM